MSQQLTDSSIRSITTTFIKNIRRQLPKNTNNTNIK